MMLIILKTSSNINQNQNVSTLFSKEPDCYCTFYDGYGIPVGCCLFMKSVNLFVSTAKAIVLTTS